MMWLLPVYMVCKYTQETENAVICDKLLCADIVIKNVLDVGCDLYVA